jgi:serine/threonine-protein kinase
MGSVYEAQHTVIGRRFALKFLRAELRDSRRAILRFEREAKLAGSIEDERIAAVVDFGVASDGVPFLVMELLVGGDLAELISRYGMLPAPRAANIAREICLGLATLHARGIVHRDLKPHNVFISKRSDGTDQIKLLDFGIAKLYGEARAEAPEITNQGAAVGTPAYMAPEQARGEPDLDGRVDVYALGVILYEALTGTKPHRGDSYNAVLFSVLTQSVEPVASRRPGLPGGLADVVDKAMARDRSERFANIGEFADALAHFCASRATNSVAPAEVVDESTNDEPIESAETLPENAQNRPAPKPLAGTMVSARKPVSESPPDRSPAPASEGDPSVTGTDGLGAMSGLTPRSPQAPRRRGSFLLIGGAVAAALAIGFALLRAPSNPRTDPAAHENTDAGAAIAPEPQKPSSNAAVSPTASASAEVSITPASAASPATSPARADGAPSPPRGKPQPSGASPRTSKDGRFDWKNPY